jgi:hypothetical protein
LLRLEELKAERSGLPRSFHGPLAVHMRQHYAPQKGAGPSPQTVELKIEAGGEGSDPLCSEAATGAVVGVP